MLSTFMSVFEEGEEVDEMFKNTGLRFGKRPAWTLHLKNSEAGMVKKGDHRREQREEMDGTNNKRESLEREK